MQQQYTSTRGNSRNSRALDLYNAGHVNRHSDYIFTVKAQNGGLYYTTNIETGNCNCPDTHKLCKHARAAMIYAAKNRPATEIVDGPAKTSKPAGKWGRFTNEQVAANLAKMGAAM